MSAAEMRVYLKEEYGIRNDEEFEAEVNASKGINLGMFTEPLERGVMNDKTKSKNPVW